MATPQHIRNPIEWGWDSLKQTGRAMGTAGNTMEGAWEGHDRTVPAVQRSAENYSTTITWPYAQGCSLQM